MASTERLKREWRRKGERDEVEMKFVDFDRYEGLWDEKESGRGVKKGREEVKKDREDEITEF